jgi:hypothetical protein
MIATIAVAMDAPTPVYTAVLLSGFAATVRRNTYMCIGLMVIVATIFHDVMAIVLTRFHDVMVIVLTSFHGVMVIVLTSFHGVMAIVVTSFHCVMIIILTSCHGATIAVAMDAPTPVYTAVLLSGFAATVRRNTYMCITVSRRTNNCYPLHTST